MSFKHETEIMHGMGELGKSRSQKKRESSAQQKLGEELCSLPANVLADFNLPAELAEAIHDLQQMKKHEAKRRQLQFIGRLMRELDIAELERLETRFMDLNHRRQADTALQHMLEELREQLIVEESRTGALESIVLACPEAELKKLRHLAESAAAERKSGKNTGFGRELFRYLKVLYNNKLPD